MMKVTPEEFELWSALIYELTGIVLTPSKTYLIENRLFDVIRETNSNSFKDLYFKCRYATDNTLKETIINRISTQETSFFRDPHVYIALKSLLTSEIIPDKTAGAGPGRPPRLRIWSAACSHGQEPYSLAMLLSETIHDIDKWDLQILATDIADNAFRKASLGRYTELEVKRGLDAHHLGKYFTKRDDGLWQVSDRTRAFLSFRKINLVSDNFTALGPFDLILCRNVAIYFDHETKIKLFTKLERVLAKDGRLLVGATENLSQIINTLVPVHRYKALYYVKPEQAGNVSGRTEGKPLFTSQPSPSNAKPASTITARPIFPTTTKTTK